VNVRLCKAAGRVTEKTAVALLLAGFGSILPVATTCAMLRIEPAGASELTRTTRRTVELWPAGRLSRTALTWPLPSISGTLLVQPAGVSKLMNEVFAGKLSVSTILAAGLGPRLVTTMV